MEVSFYPGCTAHSTGLEYTLSIKAVFDALKVKLNEIDDWNCCGAAAAHSMSNLLGLALPARNIAKAQMRDLPLAVPCAGCFNAIKRAQYALQHDPGMKKQLEEVVKFKYKDNLDVKLMHDVIFEYIGLNALKKQVKKPLKGLKTVSYYGCALVRNPKIVKMGDHENPMFLDAIVDALGGEVVDWSYKTDCCGASLVVTRTDLVRKLSQRLLSMAREAEADCIVTGCTMCQSNLDTRQEELKRDAGGKFNLPVLYFTELIGLALGHKDVKKWLGRHITDPIRVLRAKGLV